MLGVVALQLNPTILITRNNVFICSQSLMFLNIEYGAFVKSEIAYLCCEIPIYFCVLHFVHRF